MMPIRIEKREIVANLFGNPVVARVLETMPRQRVLMVLNYHRIGNASESPYDPGIFSATTAQFDWQIRYLKRRFHMTTLDEAVAMATGEAPVQTSVLITFDDGYLDNYGAAFPILRSHGVQGVFFLPTAFIGTNHVPWWDVIAYILKNSRNDVIHLQYPKPIKVDLRRQGMEYGIANILRLYKSPATKQNDRFIADLEVACQARAPAQNLERCLMNWQEAREMQDAGMNFGSHTHTHEILSKLPIERQREELELSREALESHLRGRVDVLAYPVGCRHCFTPETMDAARSVGYRAAFSFYGGFNRPGMTDPFNVCRVGAGPQSNNRFRLRLGLGAFTAKWWI
jgi:peptidoglycan/xylan/chitin deacetylase (PgdA/CDA1 family)